MAGFDDYLCVEGRLTGWMNGWMHKCVEGKRKKEKRKKCTERETKRINSVSSKKIKDSMHVVPLKSLFFLKLCIIENLYILGKIE